MSAQTILVLDDNPENLKLVLHYLRAKGFAVQGVSSTAEADAAVATSRPDLVLVDIALPHEDGLRWVQRVRGLRHAPAHFVALTAQTDPEVRQRAREAGCEGFLTKPVPLKALLAMVESCLTGSPDPA